MFYRIISKLKRLAEGKVDDLVDDEDIALE